MNYQNENYNIISVHWGYNFDNLIQWFISYIAVRNMDIYLGNIFQSTLLLNYLEINDMSLNTRRSISWLIKTLYDHDWANINYYNFSLRGIHFKNCFFNIFNYIYSVRVTQINIYIYVTHLTRLVSVSLVSRHMTSAWPELD